MANDSAEEIYGGEGHLSQCVIYLGFVTFPMITVKLMEMLSFVKLKRYGYKEVV